MHFVTRGSRTPHPCEFLVQTITLSPESTPDQKLIMDLTDIAGNRAVISFSENILNKFLEDYLKVLPTIRPLVRENFDSSHSDFKFLPSYHSENLRIPLDHYNINALPELHGDVALMHPTSLSVYSNLIGGALDYNAHMMLKVVVAFNDMTPELIARFRATRTATFAKDMDVWVFLSPSLVASLTAQLQAFL